MEIQRGNGPETEFAYKNRPEPTFRVVRHGPPEITRWVVDYEKQEDPRPEQFERVCHIEVKLAVMLPDLDDELREKADAALDAVQDFQRAMIERRDLTQEQEMEVSMGNLDALPEVEERVSRQVAEEMEDS